MGTHLLGAETSRKKKILGQSFVVLRKALQIEYLASVRGGQKVLFTPWVSQGHIKEQPHLPTRKCAQAAVRHR